MNTRILLFLITISSNASLITAFLPQSNPQRQCQSSTISTISSTSLNMKNSHRARLEKNLEDMMGNDWRMFRAQLVAQELHEKRNPRNDTSTSFSYSRTPVSTSRRAVSSSHHEQRSSKTMKAFGEPLEASDEKQARQEKFGNIFAAIFSNSNKESGGTSSSNTLEKRRNTRNNQRSSNRYQNHQQRSIFDGHNIGGATPDSMIPNSCEDPFVSEAELPVLLKPRVQVDKHRWAHPLSHIEPGCVLIANEKLGGVFHQTVVLIVEHNEGSGSTGIVINRPLAGNLLKVASETKSNVDLSLKLAFNSATVTYGGPVLQEEYSVLHGYGNVDGSKKVAPGVFVGGSEELMKEVRRRNLHPNDALFVKGHAAWVPNQLAREISKGVWYPASCSSDFLLRYAGAPISDDDNTLDLWSDILTCMGDNYAEIATNNSGKGDMRMMP